MAKDELSATYASPGLRWGLFKEDYPQGTYRFTVEKGTDLDPPVPPEFGGDGDFVVAVIDRADGTPVITGYKDIPTEVERWTGASGHRTKTMVPFERTPDNWQVLCTKALGRALKRAGYPDDTKDLKALILWRQRRMELAAIERGVILTPIAIGTGSDKADDLDKAGGADHYGDGEHDPENPDRNEVIDASSIDVTTIKWSPEALDALAGLPDSTVREVWEMARARNIDVADPGSKAPILMAMIEAKKASPASSAPSTPPGPPPAE